MNVSPREIAYLAVLGSLREESFVEDKIETWRQSCQPAARDLHFCQAIAYGAVQMALALDYLAEQLTAKHKLKLKLKERALLRLALYQCYFMDRVPLFAIANESVAIAKRYCSQHFGQFLNAILRKTADVPLALPRAQSIEGMSIRYSYPPYFVSELVRDYGPEQAVSIMEVGNAPGRIMVRQRNGAELMPAHGIVEGLKPLSYVSFPMAEVSDVSQLPLIAASADFYIQNITPAALMHRLCAQGTSPVKLLDLCASPGGKLLAAHDFLPQAELFANDVSEEKLMRLRQNMQKYGMQAKLSCLPGENYPQTAQFDVVILDVPCSNTGVLHKRPEARWRISEESLDALEKTQLRLIEHACQLLAPQGCIWYMTCSILKRENELLIQKACRNFGLVVYQQQDTILPNLQGWDGGFACSLQIAQRH